MRGMVWFREDLRTFDHTALHHATTQCTDGVVAIFLVDTPNWVKHHMAACRVDFMLRGLKELHDALTKLHIPLLIRYVDDSGMIPVIVYDAMKLVKADILFFNNQYEVNEHERDEQVQYFLASKKITCSRYHDQKILPPKRVRTQKGEYFSVFTPYKRAWLQALSVQNGIKLLPVPKKQMPLAIESDPIPTSVDDFKSTIDDRVWPAGERIARKRLDAFIDKKLFLYDKQRDFPAIDGTSLLSPYLAVGMISARECFSAALFANQNELHSGNSGALTWMSELIWRDFYKDILMEVPRVSMHKPFKIETDKLAWRYDEKQLHAWQQGMTGFPLIDAAMRQLNTTGWMHNRLRMVVAMFFSKNLLLDWRLGEDYFIQHLIDGDLSANNGGWQWSASTGTDAAPYFRIFNPIRQSERFDPEGDFIRQYCPELRHLEAKKIHAPLNIPGYPAPLVNLDVTRQQAILAFKEISS